MAAARSRSPISIWLQRKKLTMTRESISSCPSCPPGVSTMRKFAPIICLLLAVPCYAQRGGGMSSAHMAFSGGHTFQRGITSISRPGFPGEFARFRGAGLVNLGYPFWGDGGSEISSQPNIIVLQNGAGPAPQRMAEPDPKPADPLLIELKGDRYVRVGSKSAGFTDRDTNT